MVYSSYLRKSTNNTEKDVNLFFPNGNWKNKSRLNQQVALINKHKSSIGFHYSNSRKSNQGAPRKPPGGRNVMPTKMPDTGDKKFAMPINQQIFTKVLQDLSHEQN